MNEIEYKAIQSTKKLKRFSRFSDKRNESIHSVTVKNSEEPLFEEKLNNKIITPFEEIDDDAFTS
ncbi:hypothetical protein [Chryseobacterium bernardetii]|uniref:hypothetical protein n=1 Tax=Chryseobacterium bernardetii TaxID=1241978 RepID=UPI000F4ECD90|nr:hypothetical protein [Chryseobacterium bernardetii]AZB34809.1 hypothetical protein EG351_15110 [Chryseobacterium bernardetii]